VRDLALHKASRQLFEVSASRKMVAQPRDE
jgi:hypothetical protein